jgi:RNA polymerase sigma-70 factor (ECF subfamily)
MVQDAQGNLINAAKAGDKLAFDAVIGPLIAPAYQLALSMLTDAHEAQDVLQEATLRAWLKLGQLHDGRPLRPWFFAIVANQCRMVRRGPWWRVLKAANMRASVHESDDTILSALDLGDAVRRLSPEERLPLMLYFYLDLPMSEVAKVLGVSVSAAKARVYRSVRRLRPTIGGEEAIV